MEITIPDFNESFDKIEENKNTLNEENELISNRFKEELRKKLSKIFEFNNEEDKNFLESLKTLSTFYGKNNQFERNNLKNQIENRSIMINRKFLHAFSLVNNVKY
jgi:ribosomal protein RSM22 (predicted rRNA methylase)